MLRKILLFFLWAAVGLLLFKVIHTVDKENNIKKHISVLPDFEFYDLKEQPFKRLGLNKNQSMVLIYFNSGCEHCQYETEQIIKNEEQLKEAVFLLVSNQSKSELLKFDSSYQIAAHPFIKLLRDSTDSFPNIFGTSIVPTVFIYNKDDKLVKFFKGEVKIEAIIEAIKQ